MNLPNKTLLSIARGVFDTDGSFWCEKSNAKTSVEWKRTHNYKPEISYTSCSIVLLKQIQKILSENEIYSILKVKNKKGYFYGRNVNVAYSLKIRRKNDILKFFSVVKPNNPRHITRYEVWRKIGYLPPKTSILERRKILE